MHREACERRKVGNAVLIWCGLRNYRQITLDRKFLRIVPSGGSSVISFSISVDRFVICHRLSDTEIKLVEKGVITPTGYSCHRKFASKPRNSHSLGKKPAHYRHRRASSGRRNQPFSLFILHLSSSDRRSPLVCNIKRIFAYFRYWRSGMICKQFLDSLIFLESGK